MRKFQVKKAFSQFIVAFITCLILEYLSHDLMNSVRIGLGIGLGVAIAAGLGK